MATFKRAGVGAEAVGDPMGAGGELHVVRARAVAGQVIRVTFDEAPLFRSAAGQFDGQNPSNYLVEVIVGQVVPAPLPVGVDNALIVGPAAGVQGPPSDERAVDVHTDKQLVVGVTYRITAVNIRSKFAGELGFPFSADFPGMVQRVDAKPLRRDASLIDIANDIALGAYTVDDSGDLAPEGGVASLRKRIFRRLTTSKGAFSFLPGYGVGLRLKEVASVGQLASIKSDVESQIKQEPEVKDVKSTLTLRPEGILTVTMQVSTKRGALVEITAQRLPGGQISL